ncbi:MAG TPA: TetR/AcrR family transcriptional regulator [Solirubrobacterales bacterium]|nr:TetR/AcrR family transcriptional regulator [Solirubrobacterales bacterium]
MATPRCDPADVGAGDERFRQAMVDLCFEVGYGNVTVPMLLKRAELGEEEFDRCFEDLEDCFCQALEAYREDFFAYLGRAMALAEPESWADRLRAVAYGLLRYLRADPARTHFLTVELGRAGERATLIWTETIVKPLFDLIDEGRSARADPASLTRSTADAIGGGILLQILAAVEKGDLEEGDRVVPQLMYSAVLPYLGPVAAERELHAQPPPVA